MEWPAHLSLVRGGGVSLGLGPLGEVIYYDDYEFALALANGQRSQYVQPPLLEGLGTGG